MNYHNMVRDFTEYIKRLKAPDIITMWAGLLLLILPFRTFAQKLPYQNDYASGLDVSFVKQHEYNVEKYMDTDSVFKPSLQIFRQHGYNWGRVMICNEPASGRLPQDLNYVISAARDLKKFGYFFLLDYMFSNGWANPMVLPIVRSLEEFALPLERTDGQPRIQ